MCCLRRANHEKFTEPKTAISQNLSRSIDSSGGRDCPDDTAHARWKWRLDVLWTPIKDCGISWFTTESKWTFSKIKKELVPTRMKKLLSTLCLLFLSPCFHSLKNWTESIRQHLRWRVFFVLLLLHLMISHHWHSSYQCQHDK